MNDSLTQEDFREDNLARQIVDSAMAVHKAFGPGLLESVYEMALCHELGLRGIPFVRQKPFPVLYKDVRLETDFRLDMLVDDMIIVELKAVETIQPVHEAQILTYMKLAQKRLGLIVNFNVPLIRDGIKRVVLRK